MAYDQLDTSKEVNIKFTLNEIRFLTSFTKKIQELFPEEGHYFIHKTTNVLLAAFKSQLSEQDQQEVDL